MTLGQRIYNLRTERNLSQTELAERLDVSRQSVSKWETDASVPDLDKLVKLCEVFSVSLDELVRGITRDEGKPGEPMLIIREKSSVCTRELMGIVLIAVGILGALILVVATRNWGDALLLIPLVICGVVCLVPNQMVRVAVGGGALLLGVALAVVFAVETGNLLVGLFALPALLGGIICMLVKQ